MLLTNQQPRCAAANRRRGWWHYAVALSPSLTAQSNFYHAASNTDGLVQLVMQKLKGAKGAGAPSAR